VAPKLFEPIVLDPAPPLRLPPIDDLVQQSNTPKPAPQPPALDQLPDKLPKLDTVPTQPSPVFQPAPAQPSALPGATFHEAAPCDPAGEQWPIAPAGLAGNPSASPVRNRVFGSPPVNLSRDYHFRDVFGFDLFDHSKAMADELGNPVDRFFLQADLLLWWQNQGNIPVLATTTSDPAGFGFLGAPGTQILLGPGRFGPSFQTGFRIRGGGYIDECANLGLDGGFFFLGRGSESRSFDSNQFPTLTRPIFSPNINAEFGELVARPGLATGRLVIEQDSFLWGIDINLRRATCRTCDSGTGWVAGYRHVNLTENLRMTEFITATGPEGNDPPGTQIVVGDHFQTKNQFHGPQVGWWWHRQLGALDYDARVSLAMGATNQIITINGFQQRTRPGEATQNFVGGLLATGPNIGTFRRTAFSVVPEVTFNMGLRLSPNFRIYTGYNFLYWSNVVRPGDQIDRVVDVTRVPNPPANFPPSNQVRPLPTLKQSNFWAQGIQLGAELRW
jgi:hypothetical protein